MGMGAISRDQEGNANAVKSLTKIGIFYSFVYGIGYTTSNREIWAHGRLLYNVMRFKW